MERPHLHPVSQIARIRSATASRWVVLVMLVCSANTLIADDARRLVLLQSDRVLTGRVRSSSDDSVTIELDARSTLAIPIRQIVAIEATATQLHLARQRHLRARGHDWQSLRHDRRQAMNRIFRDVQWCLDLDLQRQARGLLSLARNLDASDPRLNTITQRMSQRDAAPASDVRRVNFETALPAAVPEPEIDGSLLHAFTSRVQPILFARCGQCHDDRYHTGDWSLTMPIGDRRSPVSKTKRNLIATLDTLVGDGADRWLEQAQQPHGPASAPGQRTAAPIPEHDAALLETLRQWTIMVANTETPITSTPPDDAVAVETRLRPVTSPTFELDRTPPSSSAQSTASPSDPPTGVRRLPRVDDPHSPQAFNRETEILRSIDWSE